MQIVKNNSKGFNLLFVIMTALYYHPIMLERFKIVTYFYFYAIPIFFLALHVNWTFKFIQRMFSSKSILFTLSFLFITMVAIFSPFLRGTNDLSYFKGPILQMIKTMVSNTFLVCFYEHHVDRKPTTLGFLKYFVSANVLYVFGTLILIVTPPLRQVITANVHMTELQENLTDQGFYVSRIGWSGYSGFDITFGCTLSVAICSLMIMYYRKQLKTVIFYNILLTICLIGNMCYGRSGLIVSIICIVILMFGLMLDKSSKWLIYPIIVILLFVVFTALISYSKEIAAWYHWTFAQLEQYQKTGNVKTHTVTRLIEMYVIPEPGTLFFGDGWYTEPNTGRYYMHTDVGLLRPIYFYGIFCTLAGYFMTLGSSVRLVKNVYGLNRTEKWIMYLMLFLILFVFEMKGEVYYIMFFYLFPVCMLKDVLMEGVMVKIDQQKAYKLI